MSGRNPLGPELTAAAANMATGDFLYGQDISDGNKVKKFTGAEVLAGSGVTATAAEINSAADVSSRFVSVGDVDTHVVLTTDTGKTHGIPQVTGNIAITMPALSAGLEYTFVSSALTAEGDNWVITSTSDFGGGLMQVDTDGSAAAVISNGSSKNTCTIIAPLAGTRIHFICDGTNWIASGTVCAIAPPTFTEV